MFAATFSKSFSTFLPYSKHFLQENIRSFVLAVLLSSKLSAYKKDSVPVGHIMVCLSVLQCNIQ
jgi:hypothetical protein